MAMDDNILLKLREMKESFTPVERMIADYILKNPKEIPKMSIKMLAIHSKTSDASVLRFCKSLGYSGYRSFIVGISTSIVSSRNQEDGEYTDIRPGDAQETLVNNVVYNNIKAIEDTQQILSAEVVKRAVELISGAKRLVFYGVGASGLVCLDAEQKFMRINRMCHAHTDGHSQLTSATLLEEQDVAILISYSGRTVELLDALSILKQRNVPVIAITKCQKGLLTEQADIILNVSTPEISLRSGAMGSRIAMLTVIDILFSAVASKQYSEVKQYLVETHEVVSKRRKKMKIKEIPIESK